MAQDARARVQPASASTATRTACDQLGEPFESRVKIKVPCIPGFSI